MWGSWKAGIGGRRAALEMGLPGDTAWGLDQISQWVAGDGEESR